jgi:hypothetical protein
MNKKVNIDSEVLKTLYRENKDFLVPIFAILASIIIIIFFIIPQFNGFIAKQNQIQTEEDKLANLNQSLSVLNSTSDTVLDNDISKTSIALPASKDFASILNAISNAASVSNVSLGDFEFSIGDVSGVASSGSIVPSLKISLNNSGSTQSVINFLSQLDKSAPISEVTSVKSAGNFSSIDVDFYYKPFPPKGLTNPGNIHAISPANQSLIDNINIPLSTDIGSVENTSSLGSPL